MDALINFLSMKLFTEVSAMNAENNQRIALGQSMAYTNYDYFEVMKEYDERLQGMIEEANKKR